MSTIPPDDRGRLAAELAALLPRLRRFARTLARDPEDADDLVQSALERGLGRLDQWQAGTRLDSWMFRIVQNLWIDWLRSPAGRLRGDHVPLDDAAELAGSDGRDGEVRVDLQRTLAAMQRLPHDQRVVVALVCVEALTYQEAAAVLEVPVGTVMSRLARGRQRLHQMLQPGTGTAEDGRSGEERHG